jgi:hypothetical protein
VVVIATDICGNSSTDQRAISVRQAFDGSGLPCSQTFSIPGAPASSSNEVRVQSLDRRPATWVSQLDVVGGRGQVVLNGSDALFPVAGRAPLSVRPRSGGNRVEAQLVQGQGRAGLWRFELAGDRTVAGSLRVIAGEVALVTGDVVVFRLKGQPGERVVFTFTGR